MNISPPGRTPVRASTIAPGAAAEDILFYVQQFARTRFRGLAHLESDFRRFAAAYRIAASDRRRVKRVLDLLYAA